MGTRLKKKYTSANLITESVLTDWVRASSDVYTNYRKICAAINLPGIGSNPPEQEKQFIGQCPRAILIELAITMQQELERLLLDMETIDLAAPVSSKQVIKRLVDHTTRLTELNHQAQIRLDLVAYSPS